MRPEAACRHSAVDSTVQLKVWKMPRRSSLAQPRTLAHKVGSGPDRPARPPRMPPANPTRPSASLPPKVKAIGLRLRNSVGNTTSSTPKLILNTCGSACAIISVPSGTPARPPTTNGHTSFKSNDRQNDGSVEGCATIEQISTSGTAVVGGSTYSQIPSAISAVPKPASPTTKPPASAPQSRSVSAAVVIVNYLVIPGRIEDANLRCAIAHRGISRFRVSAFARPGMTAAALARRDFCAL